MWPFKRKTLKESLNPTKTLTIKGIRFTIKKLNPEDYLSGQTDLLSSYETYSVKAKESGSQTDPNLIKKLKKFYRQMFLAGVVSPKLSSKGVDECGDMVSVDEIFNDWGLASELCIEILAFTHGKKKVIQALRQQQS